MSWITARFTEPSSYASAGAMIVGAGVLLGQPWIIVVGIVGGIVGFFLKEKGKI
jgi:hypothetical protein